MYKLKIASALILSATLAACGGGDPKSASDKPKSLLPDGINVSSSSASSSSAPSNIVNEVIPFHENFDNAVNTVGFFSPAYKGLNTDSDLPFYHATGGFLAEDENGNIILSPTTTSWITGDANPKLQLGNGRFTLGQTRLEAGTTTADTSVPTWGEFDLSKPYKLSFCVVQVSSPSASNFEVYVDNNTTGGNNSRYGAGNASRILQIATHALVAGTRHEVVVPGSSGVQIGTSTSFLQFRVSSGGFAVIDDLVIEYVGEPHGFSLPTCVAETSLPPQADNPPATPAAPSVASGNASLTVTWPSSGPGVTYELFYNTENSAEGAVPFSGNPLSDTSAQITGLANGTTYYVFLRAANSIGVSGFSDAATGTPALPPVVNPGSTLLTENFTAADVAAFFSPEYKSLPGDAGARMYVPTAGQESMTLTDGKLSFFNARFTIGDKGTATNSTSQPNGVFDLTKPYRVKFIVHAAEGTGNIQLYVDNNTTGAGNSIHASVGNTASRLRQITPADIPSFPYEFVVDSELGTATSFFQLRADSGITNFVISDLVIEYRDGAGGEGGDTLLNENFDGVIDSPHFFSVDYKTLPDNPAVAMYVGTAGATRVTFAGGALSMTNARFTVGNRTTTDTASGVAPEGIFDLTRPYRVKFNVLAAEGRGNFQVYVDNNTTGAGNSIHASIGSTASRLYQQTPANITSFPYEVTINSDIGTATSFFQIRADSGITNLTIDDLVIEYQ